MVTTIKWKNKKFLTQIDGSIKFNKDSSITVVYIRLNNNNNLQKSDHYECLRCPSLNCSMCICDKCAYNK